MAGDERSLVPQALAALDPRMLDYGEWLSVGMAMKAEGFPFEEFLAWSAQNTERFAGEADLMSHWRSFDEGNASSPVRGGTIVELARKYGALPDRAEGHALDWSMTSAPVIDMAWVEPAEIPSAGCDDDPCAVLARYIEAVFDADDYVGYVTESFEREGRYSPASAGYYDRTAAQLLEALAKYPGDLPAAIGASDPAAGAWIRFNPLDGQGARNANVVAWRHALVECDELDKSQQLAMIHALNLPCSAVVDSGGKSVHAIVRVDAADYDEYRKRVDFLYETCRKNGMPIDGQNKNPSRLSRMPGVMRGGQMQALIEVGTGAHSWDEWREWLAEETDDLPEVETLASVWDNMPDLAPPLIHGVLRQGHKMMLAGPSKAGKSFCLMELAIAIAEGGEWMGFQCAQGPVLYVNLEIDRASCLQRFKRLYDVCGIAPEHVGNIHIWSLRGKAQRFDEMAPILIRRALKIRPAAIIIDPIYKIITGDENSASDMAAFTNLFDRVTDSVGCATIVCHHHSKGFQGAKRSMDRLSGSGVFARDPDALVDMSELWLDKGAREFAHGRTGWRMSFTLREFADPGEVDVWFDYPRHVRDEHHILEHCGVEGDPDTNLAKGREFNREKTRERAAEDQSEKVRLMDDAFRSCKEDGVVPTRAAMLERIGEFEGKKVTKGQLDSWTVNRANWSPFRVIDNITHAVGRVGEDGVTDVSFETVEQMALKL